MFSRFFKNSYSNLCDHSSRDLNPRSYNVVLGAHERNPLFAQKEKVANVVIHPQYDSNTVRHDIALIQLQVIGIK
jgi:hypothetical protein